MKRILDKERGIHGLPAGTLASFPWIPCLALILFFLPSGGLSATDEARTRNVVLTWALSPEEDVAGYRIHYGPLSRYDEEFDGYPHVIDLRPGDYVVTDKTASYELEGLSEGQTFWISITAYDDKNNESTFSNEKKVLKEAEPPGPIMPCQAIPPSFNRGNLRTLSPAWGVLFLSVSIWILALRRRIHCRSEKGNGNP